MKVNKMCSYWGFKAISDERAHDDSRFSVNFGPMKLIFGPLERGEQGLSTEPTFNFIGPLKDQKGLPSLTGRRSQPQSVA